MGSWRTGCGMALSIGLSLGGGGAPDAPAIHFERGIKGVQGQVTACTPWKVYRRDFHKVFLTNPSRVAPNAVITEEQFAATPQHSSVGACVRASPVFSGRFTEAHLTELEKGTLDVGMPIEFAELLLGAPTEAPTRVRTLDSGTGKVLESRIYRWTRTGNAEGIAMLLTVVAVAAAPVQAGGDAYSAAVTSSTTGQIGEDIAKSGKAAIVTAEVDAAGLIVKLSVQGGALMNE